MEPTATHANEHALVESYMPTATAVVRSLMRRIRPGLVDYDDCVQAAALAVLQCARRFDPSMGVPFSGFARPRVRGAVFDLLRSELRSRGTFGPVVERLAERAAYLGSTNDQDDFESGVDLIADLGLGLMLEAGLSYSDPAESCTAPYLLCGRPIGHFIALLPERHAHIIRSHYIEGVSFSEIALAWNVSRGRVSQLHGAALRNLRQLVEKCP